MKLAVYLGGIGYHCDKPLLYYAREVAYDNGYTEYINIDYSITIEHTGNKETDIKVAYEQAFSVAEKRLLEVDWSKYDDILFVSKSLGTVVAVAFEEKLADVLKEKKIQHVFLTPLDLTFEFNPENGIAFVGTKDPVVEVENIEKCCEKCGVKLLKIEDVNHSLEGDDLWRNLEILKNVMRKINLKLSK